MKDSDLCGVALFGFFMTLVGLMAIILLVYPLLGLALYAVWEYAVRAVWPGLPVIVWWQFSLMAWGIAILKGLVTK